MRQSKLLQAFLHKIATCPDENSGSFAWISTNPCCSKISLYSVMVRSLPWVCTSIFRDCRRVLLGPVLSSFKNFSATRRPPPNKTQQIKVPMKWKIIAAYLNAFKKIQQNSIFLFGLSVFVLKILTFLCYANEESDDLVNCVTKIGKYSVKNISWNIGVVIFKLGSKNAHHQRIKMTPVVLLLWQQFCRWSCLN